LEVATECLEIRAPSCSSMTAFPKAMSYLGCMQQKMSTVPLSVPQLQLNRDLPMPMRQTRVAMTQGTKLRHRRLMRATRPPAWPEFNRMAMKIATMMPMKMMKMTRQVLSVALETEKETVRAMIVQMQWHPNRPMRSVAPLRTLPMRAKAAVAFHCQSRFGRRLGLRIWKGNMST